MKTRFGKCLSAWVIVFCLCFVSVVAAPPALAIVTDDITSTDLNFPTTLTAGKAFALRGIVASEESKIIRLEAGAYKNGKMVTGRSWNPNAKSVDFRWYVNPFVEFGKLSAGSYSYKVTATNSSVKRVLLDVSFEVTPAPAVSDTLTAAGCNFPDTLTQGKGFALRGVVSSQTTKITKLQVGVFDESGKMVTGRSYNPKVRSVDIRWAINPHVKFAKLDAGTYTYRIIAKNAAGEQTLLSEMFDVGAPDPVSDELSTSGCNYPSEIVKGKGFALRGIVKSQSSKLTNVTVGVYDEDDNRITGRSFNPKAKAVDFRWLINPFVKFGSLDVGTYTYQISATNAAGEETLLSETFEVVPAQAASDNLSASGLTSPTLLIKGRGYALKGIVSSQTSKITNLTAGVFDSDGKLLTGRSFNPKAKSVDLRWYIDSHVKFGALPIGTYTYKVVATNDAGTTTLLETAFEVVE